MEENTSRKKFNMIDVLIIVLVILCVVGIYFRSHIMQWVGIDTQIKDYSITFQVSEIRASSEKYFAAGERIYLDSPEMSFGVIDGNCSVTPAEKFITTADGIITSVTYPEATYVDVVGSVKCEGAFRSEEGFYLEGSYLITPGMTLKVHTEKLDFVITVVNIEEYGV